MPRKGDRRAFSRMSDDILACGSEFILIDRFAVVARLATHLGISISSVRYYVTNESDLIRQLCQRHLNDFFDVVCCPTDWCGTPIGILRAMALALLGYAEEKPSRHLVFLLHRHSLNDPTRSANDTQLAYLTNNFQLALQNVQPQKPFDTLHSPARMFVGQILNLPLWWPAEPHMSKDEWLCQQIGQAAGIASPDWRLPAASRIHGHDTLDHWGERRPADPPSQLTA